MSICYVVFRDEAKRSGGVVAVPDCFPEIAWMSDADESTFSRSGASPSGQAEMHERVCSAAEIFSKHSARIRAIIAFHVEDKSKVDDFFQQFFISLVRNPIPAHIEDVEKYLYRALANDVIDSCRQANQYRDRLQQYAEQHRYDETAEDPQDDVLHVEAAKEMFSLLEKRLSKLQAEVVWHHYGKGLSRKATARKTNLDEKTVVRYISLARKKMRKFIPHHTGNTK